jgi:RNA polymerase sigma-70 factor (ECF subfamily)
VLTNNAARPVAELIDNSPATGADEFRVLHEECSSALFDRLMWWTRGNRQLAEDVLQETLIRAWNNLPNFDPRKSRMPWLITVARRIMIDQHRRRTARPEEIHGQTLDTVTIEDQVDSILASVVVTDALQSLSAQHRAVIGEVYFRGSSTAQAAHALGIPPGTVKSRSYYALRALRSALEERGVTGVHP